MSNFLKHINMISKEAEKEEINDDDFLDWLDRTDQLTPSQEDIDLMELLMQ